jgi:hypothetical protein
MKLNEKERRSWGSALERDLQVCQRRNITEGPGFPVEQPRLDLAREDHVPTLQQPN